MNTQFIQEFVYENKKAVYNHDLQLYTVYKWHYNFRLDQWQWVEVTEIEDISEIYNVNIDKILITDN